MGKRKKIKFSPIECPKCHEIIPGDALVAHQREKHKIARRLVNSSESPVRKKPQHPPDTRAAEERQHYVFLSSLRGRLVSGGYVYPCFNCCISVNSAWKYRTTEGDDLYLCGLCKEKIIVQQFGYGAPRNGMWSRMVVTNFETNRRKH